MVKQMIKIRWELEEAVALFDVYFNNGGNLNVSEDVLVNLTNMYIKRAKHKKSGCSKSCFNGG